MHVIDNILYKIDFNNNRLVVVPSTMVKDLFELYHSHKLSGHYALDKTLKKLEDNFFWLNMRQDIDNLTERCETCQKCKSGSNKKAPLQPIITLKAWQLIQVDVIGPLLRSMDGNKYILLAIDHFSK